MKRENKKIEKKKMKQLISRLRLRHYIPFFKKENKILIELTKKNPCNNE